MNKYIVLLLVVFGSTLFILTGCGVSPNNSGGIDIDVANETIEIKSKTVANIKLSNKSGSEFKMEYSLPWEFRIEKVNNNYNVVDKNNLVVYSSDINKDYPKLYFGIINSITTDNYIIKRYIDTINKEYDYTIEFLNNSNVDYDMLISIYRYRLTRPQIPKSKDIKTDRLVNKKKKIITPIKNNTIKSTPIKNTNKVDLKKKDIKKKGVDLKKPKKVKNKKYNTKKRRKNKKKR